MSFSDMSTNSMGNVRPEQNGGHHISGSSRCDDVSLRIDNDVQEMTEFRPFLNGDVRDDYKPTVIEPEKLKALWSFGYLCLGTYILTIVLTMVHDRMPDSKTHPPLPDIILDNVPRTPWAEDIAEGLITAMGLLLGIVIIFHKHRYIVLRRFFCTTATLYLLRCITIFVTALPETGQNIDCSAKYEGTIMFRMYTSFLVFIKLGMASTGGRTCGAYMFSGHAMVMTNMNFFITEYTSSKFCLLHLISWMMSITGMFCILAAHGHYTVDVVVAYFVTCRLFLFYHTLANSRVARLQYKRARYWLPMVYFFESKSNCILPNEYEWPFPGPTQIREWLKLIFCR